MRLLHTLYILILTMASCSSDQREEPRIAVDPIAPHPLDPGGPNSNRPQAPANESFDPSDLRHEQNTTIVGPPGIDFGSTPGAEPVPEPCTLLLVGVGVLMLAVNKRRRQS